MKKKAKTLDALHRLDAKISFLGAVYDSMEDISIQGLAGYSFILDDMRRDIKEIKETVEVCGDE